MTRAWCDNCKAETQHKHMHDCAHGISGTHMAGSERYECSVCRHTIHKDDAKRGKNKHLKFILD